MQISGTSLTGTGFRAVINIPWKNCVMKIEFRKIRSIMSVWIDEIFHIQTISNQWIRKK